MSRKLLGILSIILTFLCILSEAQAVTCTKGYIAYNDSCYKQLKCKNGGKQTGNVCTCSDGWTGNLCQTAKKCPYKNTKCSKGYYATGNKCKTGKKTVIECKANECKGYNYTKCPTGYASSATCQSGKTKKYQCDKCAKGYIKYNGKCIKQLKCKNGGTQNGNSCVCKEGWIGNLCQTAEKCPYKDTKCGKGYYATGNTCKTGKKTVVECKANSCAGYDYTKCPSGSKVSATCQSGKNKKYKCECPKGQILSGDKCITKLNCQNGGTQNGTKCVCKNGWTGNLCQTAKTCPYNTTSCTDGYEETGNTCQSGNTIYKECKAKEVPDGYTIEPCGDGYTQTGTFLSGTTIYYLCEENDCSGYVTSCPADFIITETCQSGENTLYKCGCPENKIMQDGLCYEKLNCGNNRVQQGNECVCASDYIELTGECYIDLHCGAHSAQIADECVCDAGFSYVKGVCQRVGVYETSTNNNNITVDNNTEADVYGMYAENIGNVLFNAYEHNAVININNAGNGNIYGIKQDGDVYNVSSASSQDFVGKISIHNEGNGDIYGLSGNNAVNGYRSKGIIEIYNNGSGNVYGLFSETQQGRVINANQTGTGIIEIVINGGNAYGLYGNKEISNGYGNNSSGYINIENNGDGTVYGVFGQSAINSKTSQGNSNGYINILNNGNGNAYGVYGVSSSNAYSLGENAQASGFITITNKGTGNAYGIRNGTNVYYGRGYNYSQDFNGVGRIKMINQGSGNVYGMIAEGDYDLVNIKNPSSYGYAKGYIDIINEQNGNAYGMYGTANLKTVEGYYSQSYITGINLANGNIYGIFGAATDSTSATIYNGSAEYDLTSTIELVNIGTGSSVGIYALDTIIRNYSEINLHNLGDGTAIGVYGKSFYNNSIVNKIVIDRKQYTYDNRFSRSNQNYIIYKADSLFGGSSIGIYYTDTDDEYTTGREYIGIIDISNAATAYGIYSGGGTVTNNGTIHIRDIGELAYGMYVEKGSAVNSGTIQIINDNGRTAIGIYANSGTTVENTGEIRVEQESNFRYQGTNIGIYAASGSTVYNRGSIYASGLGYGIWAEDETVTIVNEGTIVASRDIQLNGGSFFQDGKLFIKGSNIGIKDNVNNEDIEVKGYFPDFAVYGLYHACPPPYYCTSEEEATAYNAKDSYASLNIHQYRNGNVYGMASEEQDIYNAYGTESNNVTGVINVNNHNNGNMYGMYISIDEMPHQGTSCNAYGSGNSNVTGIIRLVNEGTGNVYGIYNDNYRDQGKTNEVLPIIRNAFSDSVTANIYGRIEIINKSYGDAFGMYAGEHSRIDYGQGSISNDTIISENGSITSEIEIVNLGDGLAVGMHYVDYGYIINNSGEIKIHNLGKGIAVGIAGLTVVNSGNIIIDRQSYTDNQGTEDTTDDVEYIAVSDRGGTAIGIYGDFITNTGIIQISGTDSAYGIWLTGNSGDLINSGTIIINGDENSANSIVLNGGNFFMNGTFIQRHPLFQIGKVLFGNASSFNVSSANNEDIYLVDNQENYNIYGIYGFGFAAANAFEQDASINIDVLRSTEAYIYGMFIGNTGTDGNFILYNAYTALPDLVNAEINIIGHGTDIGEKILRAYGIASSQAYNAYAENGGIVKAGINIRGEYANINGIDGNYGMVSIRYPSYNAYASTSGYAEATVDLVNTHGYAIGCSAKKGCYNSYAINSGTAKAIINLSAAGEVGLASDEYGQVINAYA